MSFSTEILALYISSLPGNPVLVEGRVCPKGAACFQLDTHIIGPESQVPALGSLAIEYSSQPQPQLLVWASVGSCLSSD